VSRARLRYQTVKVVHRCAARGNGTYSDFADSLETSPSSAKPGRKDGATIIKYYVGRKGGPAPSGIFDAPFTDEYAECVVRRRSQVAIVGVKFQDGEKWLLPSEKKNAARP
jgi:hypothetical protein